MNDQPEPIRPASPRVHEFEYVVPGDKLVRDLYPEFDEFTAMPHVFASGFLIGLIEQGCILVGNPLATGPSALTVGTGFRLSHQTPSVTGSRLRVRAELVEVQGRKLEFNVLVTDGDEVVARGSHTRFIVDRHAFEEGLSDRRRSIASSRNTT